MTDTATRDYIWQRQYAAYPEESYEEGLRRVAKYVADGDEEAQRRFENILLSNRFLPGGRTLQGAASYHGNLTNCFVLDGQPASSLRERVMNLAKEMALISKVGGGVGANLDFLPGAKKEGVNPVTLLFHVHTPDTPEGDKLIRGEYLDLTTGVASSHEYPSFVQVVSADSDIPFKELPWILPEDSIEGIWDAASRMVDVLMEGKPVGVDLRKLRPEGAPVKGSGGTSSGPVSFAVEIFSNFARWAQLGAETAGPVAALRYVLAPTLRVIRQAGVRRGAGMATLSITHPDIRDWLSAKDLDREEAEGGIGTFNMSVLVPDGIMGNPTRGEKELLEEIAAHAWATGEPGIMFQDTINKSVPYHLKAKYGLVNATNPCSEVPMYPYEECCLGAINLAEHVDEDGSVDASKLIKTTWAAVEFLDKVLDVSRAPLDKILRMRYRRRRIGLGIMGLADALIKMGLKYDAPEGRTAAADMMRTIAYSAHGQSCILGKEKGFPEEVETLGRRNIALLTVAPTGTTSMLAGVAGGVEPIFSKTISRRVGNDYIQIENPLASYPAFITAHEVAPADHVLMQAAVQNAMLGDNPTIANAISKTINLPHDATVAQVEAAYRLAWLSGCKSVTVYRDGSRANQILTVKEDEDSVTEPEYRDMHQLEMLGAKNAPTREPTVSGRTYKYDVGNRKVYVTVNHNQANQLVEVFINLSRPSDQEAVAADIVGRLISLALKKGVAPSDILKHLVGFTDKTGGFVPERGFVGSLWEAVAFALEDEEGIMMDWHDVYPGTDVCPNCGTVMERQEGCLTCLTCGYSQCS